MIYLESNAWSREKVECTKCPWKGTMAEVHTTRGGHDFVCPKCGAPVKSVK